MLTRKSRLDQKVLTWLAGLDAERVMETPLTGDDFAKCVGKAASRSAVAIYAFIRTGVEVATGTTGRGGA